MKPLLLALLINLSTNAQAIEATLKAKVLELEIQAMTKSEFDSLRLHPDVEFASFQYKLMPIQLKWEASYNALTEYKGQMRAIAAFQTYEPLFKQARLIGPQKVNALTDSLGMVWIRKEREEHPKEAYLKAVYGQADPNRLIYEVTSVLKYSRTGQEVLGDKHKHWFYQDDLSEVDIRN